MRNTDDLAHDALAAFDRLIAGTPSLRPRAGQRAMAERVATTLAQGTLGRVADGQAPERRIAVIEAGTGVGKSLAYLTPAIALALQRGTRVVVSTATVALQEQLVHHDLPALAARLSWDVRWALAKGRGRYVCRLKLEQWLSDPAAVDEGHDDELPLQPTDAASEQARRAWLHARAAELAHGQWDGELDSLAQPPEPRWWAAVAADAASCSARHCPLYGGCVYFERRKALVGAHVIVVNHDLLLATLGTRQLPELDQCLLVLDEAHHLPGTALEQFGCRTGLTRLAWVDRLASRALRVAQEVGCDAVADVPQAAAQLRAALQDVARLCVQAWGERLRGLDEPLRVRLPHGRLPEGWDGPLAQADAAAGTLLAAVRALGQALRDAMRQQPDETRRLAALYSQMGTLAPRLEAASDTVRWLLHEPEAGQAPLAKWFTLYPPGGGDGTVRVLAHASPMLPGALLRARLWGQVRAAVLTSATLTSGARFDFYLSEVGLADEPDVVVQTVDSPFDHTRQGELVLAAVAADPRDLSAYQQAVQQALLRDLPTVQRGALVLFTSRAHLQRVAAALPPALRARTLVQGERPRTQLLRQHRERVAAGEPSIILGLQSFGEGLDLPGDLCAELYITKLPFAPPDDPVGEARAEWLRSRGRDPFIDLVVPATALRLKQWVGRAIRTEADHARIVCYDPRLSTTGYGRVILNSLPPFRRGGAAALATAAAVAMGAEG